MKVFISWSGPRAQLVAEGLKVLVADVLGRADPWVSSEDIAVGERWADQIGKRLQDTNYGIIVVTADNKDRPWLNFEAGAIAKSVETGKVMPYLVGLRKGDIAPPLGMFQAAVANAAGTRELIDALNRGLAAPNEPDAIARRFDANWPRLSDVLTALPALAVAVKGPATRPDRDLLEEILSLLRADARTRTDTEASAELVGRLRKLFPPVDPWLYIHPSHMRVDLLPANCTVRLNQRTGEVQRVLSDGEARSVPDDEIGVLIPSLLRVHPTLRARTMSEVQDGIYRSE